MEHTDSENTIDQQTTPHDQLFKELLESFLGDLLQIVCPTLTEVLNLETIDFLRKEFFTDTTTGQRQALDLLAQISQRHTDDPDVIVHVEIENRARRSMAERMYRYHMQIDLRHSLDAVSIVLNLKGGQPGVREKTFRRSIAGKDLVVFNYFDFSLSPTLARQYLNSPYPLALALAALMKEPEWPRSRLKLQLMLGIARADVNEAQRFLLFNCVETYLQLNDEETLEYQALLARETAQEVVEMEMTWADRMRAEGHDKGHSEGRREGHREGRREGTRAILYRQIEQRFGHLPKETRNRIEALESDEILKIADRILTATSLEDLGL